MDFVWAVALWFIECKAAEGFAHHKPQLIIMNIQGNHSERAVVELTLKQSLHIGICFVVSEDTLEVKKNPNIFVFSITENR